MYCVAATLHGCPPLPPPFVARSHMSSLAPDSEVALAEERQLSPARWTRVALRPATVELKGICI